MNSDAIDEIALALAKAQAKFPPILKDKTAKVGAYQYSYADLASVIDAVRPALQENDLCISQMPVIMPSGLTLETRLIHKSGQWLGCQYPLTMSGKQQEIGSQITYARRYSLTALLGVVAEDDDDANAADGNDARTEKKRKDPPAQNSIRNDPERQRAIEWVNIFKGQIDMCQNMADVDAAMQRGDKGIKALRNKYPDIADGLDVWLDEKTRKYNEAAE